MEEVSHLSATYSLSKERGKTLEKLRKSVGKEEKEVFSLDALPLKLHLPEYMTKGQNAVV